MSSTEPPLPESSVSARTNRQTPEISAYFKAIEHYISSSGWALLKITKNGTIETVTENIKDLIRFTRADLQKQSITSYLHPSDHAKLNPILSSFSSGGASGWELASATVNQAVTAQQPHLQQQNRSQLNQHLQQQHLPQPNDAESHQNSNGTNQSPAKRPFKVRLRMLVKDQEIANETDEQRHLRPDTYEELVIFAAPFHKDSEENSPVLCLLTRPDDEIPIETTMNQRNLEQFTFQLDTAGRITKLNTAALRPAYTANLPKESGRSIHDLCHIQDLPKLQSHLKDIMQSSTAHSEPYRLRLGGPDLYVYVKAHSRLFTSMTPENDVIMSVHTVLSESEVISIETHGMPPTMPFPVSSNQSANMVPSSVASSSSHSHLAGMGGPLMTSVVNGGVGGNNGCGNNGSHHQIQTPSTSVVTSYPSPPGSNRHGADNNHLYMSEAFDFDFGMESVGVGWDSRPDSRTSVSTPMSTPRPPSVPVFSPANSICASPLTSNYQAGGSVGQPSPSGHNNNNNNTNNNNNNLNNNNNSVGVSGFVGFNGFPDEKDTKEHLQQQLIMQQQQNHGSNMSSGSDNERLRILLTKRPHSNTSSGQDPDDGQRADNKILKGLLNADEEKEQQATVYKSMVSPNARSTHSQRAAGRPTDKKGASGSGNMLQLLLQTDKDDDDGGASGSGGLRSNQSELMRQLQQRGDPPVKEPPIADAELIQMLRIQGNDFSGRKRGHSDTDENGEKRPENRPSKLREKNKMLATLLANPPKAPTSTGPPPTVKPIPDIPQSRLQQQQHHQSGGIAQGGNLQQQQHSQLNQKLLAASGQTHHPGVRMSQGQAQRKPTEVYLNQQQPQQQMPNAQHLMRRNVSCKYLYVFMNITLI